MKLGFKSLATGMCLLTISVAHASDPVPCKGLNCLYLADQLKTKYEGMTKVVETCSNLLGLDSGPEKCQKAFMLEFAKSTIADGDLTAAANSITMYIVGDTIQQSVQTYLTEKSGSSQQKSSS